MPCRAAHPDPPPRFVVGTMTGTSIDGDLDAAMVRIEGHGLGMSAGIVATGSWPLGEVAAELRRIAEQEPLPAREFARIARAFGEAHARALDALCSGAGVQPDLAVLHGQTVFHAPPLTWQLLDPWPVAARLGCRVRYDLRSANTVSGGQGAPITPLADFVMFADDKGPKTIVNLGGFINATLLPRRSDGIDAIRGFDVCACNHLLDAVARARLGTAFDADGAAAARGCADAELIARISAAIAPPSAAERSNRRSLGTGDEAGRLVDLAHNLSAEDACRTVVEAIADALVRTIAEASPTHLAQVVLAGGSARHRTLQAAIARRCGGTVLTTEASHGVPVHMREAAEIAVLGALADDGVRYSLPQVTGAASAIPESAVLEAPISAERTQD